LGEKVEAFYKEGVHFATYSVCYPVQHHRTTVQLIHHEMDCSMPSRD